MAVLKPSLSEPTHDEYELIVRSGFRLDPPWRFGAIKYAERSRLDVLDLVPTGLEASQAIRFFVSFDPLNYRKNRIAAGRSAAHAIVLRKRLAGTLTDDEKRPTDAAAFARLARKLKELAPSSSDAAFVPVPSSIDETQAERDAALRAIFGDYVYSMMIASLALLVGAVVASPLVGFFALFEMHLELAIASVMTPLKPRRLARFTLCRFVSDVSTVFRRDAWAVKGEPDAVRALRPVYGDLLRDGIGRFFEPRRKKCPLCGSDSLKKEVEVSDLYQRKPGTFELDRCTICSHVFQNPRLSIDGLDFYYRDFYDGLGEEKLSALFSAGSRPYVMRSRSLRGLVEPKRWLDVGGGHGHFCLVARDDWPETEFDIVDLGESILTAEKKGWVNRAFRALFPDVVDRITEERGLYDVVSMSHYLEHTRDPDAEIAAAAKALAPSGILMVEVPNPDSYLRHIFGRYWAPWLQPQHQHLLSIANMARLLNANGFTPIRWEIGEAHVPCDFSFAAMSMVGLMAPAIDAPWLPPATYRQRIAHRIVWLLAMPLIGVGFLLDHLFALFSRSPKWSNTFRVLARRSA